MLSRKFWEFIDLCKLLNGRVCLSIVFSWTDEAPAPFGCAQGRLCRTERDTLVFA